METQFPSMKDKLYKLEANESEFWKLVKIFSHALCQAVNFYCCHFLQNEKSLSSIPFPESQKHTGSLRSNRPHCPATQLPGVTLQIFHSIWNRSR